MPWIIQAYPEILTGSEALVNLQSNIVIALQLFKPFIAALLIFKM